MSYEVYQINIRDQKSVVLVGRGEHDGTRCNISDREMDSIIYQSRRAAQERGYKVAKFSLLLNDPESKDGPEVKQMVAAELDRLFLRAHACPPAPPVLPIDGNLMRLPRPVLILAAAVIIACLIVNIVRGVTTGDWNF